MMQNLKPTVLTALQTATALSTLTAIYFFHPPDFTTLPVGSYFEVDNTGNLFADDQEIGSEIIFQIDLWGRDSLSDLTIGVDDTMTGIDFAKDGSGVGVIVSSKNESSNKLWRSTDSGQTWSTISATAFTLSLNRCSTTDLVLIKSRYSALTFLS